MLTNHTRLDFAVTVLAPARPLPVLLAELVVLGREAWQINAGAGGTRRDRSLARNRGQRVVDKYGVLELTEQAERGSQGGAA